MYKYQDKKATAIYKRDGGLTYAGAKEPALESHAKTFSGAYGGSDENTKKCLEVQLDSYFKKRYEKLAYRHLYDLEVRPK